MYDQFIKYIFHLYNYVPSVLYMVLLSAFCIFSIIIIKSKGIIDGSRIVAGLFVVEYVILLLCTIVVYRKTGSSIGYDFTPFWSYQVIQKGRDDLFAEKIMNVVVFVPVGLLLSCVSRRLKWWMVLLIGFCISLSIESLQFELKRGFSEVDDVIHNTFGCLIGVMIVEFMKGMWKLTSSNAITTRQSSNKFGLLSLLWQFCSYLFVPQWGRKHRV